MSMFYFFSWKEIKKNRDQYPWTIGKEIYKAKQPKQCDELWRKKRNITIASYNQTQMKCPGLKNISLSQISNATKLK